MRRKGRGKCTRVPFPLAFDANANGEERERESKWNKLTVVFLTTGDTSL